MCGTILLMLYELGASRPCNAGRAEGSSGPLPLGKKNLAMP